MTPLLRNCISRATTVEQSQRGKSTLQIGIQDVCEKVFLQSSFSAFAAAAHSLLLLSHSFVLVRSRETVCWTEYRENICPN